MFHPSSQYPFDTMFVILCVIAGASSHSFSNSSRSIPTHLLNRRHRYSFIDLILDASTIDSPRSTNSESNSILRSSDDARQHRLLGILPTDDNSIKHPQKVCSLLSNILSGSQMKFCLRHHELLEKVLPRIIELVRDECVRITRDLRWNCTTLEPFLERSSSLAFTREAALIRSMLNASMMYLIVKICADQAYHSCGCAPSQVLVNHQRRSQRSLAHEESSKVKDSDLVIDQVFLNSNDLGTLETGSPLRLSKSTIKRQDCAPNAGFADAFTRVFFDADDLRSLNRAFRTLNEARNKVKEKRFYDIDQRDLSIVRWTKSAVILHNNNLGRQVRSTSIAPIISSSSSSLLIGRVHTFISARYQLVRMSIHRQCRCHGLSGACQFQTCWHQTASFDAIASNIRSLYIGRSQLVGYKNLGSYEYPDIYLSKVSGVSVEHFEKQDTTHKDSVETVVDRLESNQLAYLYESPEFCVAQPVIKHKGTRGRECKPEGLSAVAGSGKSRQDTTQSSLDPQTSLGSCEYLCCGRGYYSELVLHVVKCDCRFKFCCKVECSNCPRQQLQHYCL